MAFLQLHIHMATSQLPTEQTVVQCISHSAVACWLLDLQLLVALVGFHVHS